MWLTYTSLNLHVLAVSGDLVPTDRLRYFGIDQMSGTRLSIQASVPIIEPLDSVGMRSWSKLHILQ